MALLDSHMPINARSVSLNHSGTPPGAPGLAQRTTQHLITAFSGEESFKMFARFRHIGVEKVRPRIRTPFCPFGASGNTSKAIQVRMVAFKDATRQWRSRTRVQGLPRSQSSRPRTNALLPRTDPHIPPCDGSFMTGRNILKLRQRPATTPSMSNYSITQLFRLVPDKQVYREADARPLVTSFVCETQPEV